MNTEFLNAGICICFAAILIFFIILLTKDSALIASLFGGKKKEKKRVKKEKPFRNDAANKADSVEGKMKGKAKEFGTVEGFAKKMKGEAAELPKNTLIYYRLPGKKNYEKPVAVKNVPFVIGNGPKADLVINDPAVAEKHAVIRLIREDDGYFYSLRNLCKNIYTEYFDQDEDEFNWVYVDKDEELILARAREAFYLGNTKIIIEPAKLERKVSKSDISAVKKGAEGQPVKEAEKEAVNEAPKEEKVQGEASFTRKKRTSSDRSFEANVLDVNEIDC